MNTINTLRMYFLKKEGKQCTAKDVLMNIRLP